MKTFVLGLVVVAGIMSSCSPKAKEETTLSGLNPKKFQAEIDGKQAGLYTLKNSAGMEVCITNFGGRIVSVLVPDKYGNRKDVVLGFDSLADYRNIPSDFGASIGRYANRIAQGRIEIDGETIQLPQNNYGHCLHGGPEGWQYQMYEANQIDGTTLELTRFSPDGDQNFPGNVRAKVRFHLTDDNAVSLISVAVSCLFWFRINMEIGKMWYWGSIVWQIIGIYPVILAPLSVGMLTGLHREESKSMAKLFNCRRITMDIVYTVGRKVGNIRCMKPIRSMVRLSN